ncbi:transcription initiation at TATA-containing promoter protein [Tritrichomonas musculus]|uniref:Transcription initiation at TATA-containing promoter protein n=1 Tax=Tritrichomonas musculus TaxID=1915356 RepID=A0ABR2KSS0_9EUKA
MELPESQKNRCLSILDTLQSYAISKMFAQPVDPVRDNVPNYFDIVKKPMDLGTVRKKLMNNEYKSVAEFKEDMELIWKNSLLVNSKTSILRLITTDMQEKYQSLAKFLSDSQEWDWLNKLYSLRDELNAMSPSRINSSSSTSSKRESKPIKQNKSNQTKQTKQKKQQPLTRAEILKLTNDINNLKDEIHILSIFEVFRKYEPQIETDSDTLVLDIAPLKPSTLWALRETVDNLLGLS